MDDLHSEILTAPDEDLLPLLQNASDDAFVALFEKGKQDALDIVFGVSDQTLANRIFAIVPLDVLRKSLSTVGASALQTLLRHTQPAHLSKLLSHASNDLVEKLIDSAPSSKARQNIAKALPADRKRQWLDYVRAQEVDVSRTRTAAVDAQGSLLEERKRLLSELDAAIRAQEEVLHSHEEESRIKRAYYDQLATEAQLQLKSLQESIGSQEAALRDREEALAARLADFEEANRRQVQQRIEIKVPEFVAAAVRVLEDREARYSRKAMHWSVHGTFVLGTAILATIGLSLYGYVLGGPLNELAWQTLVFVSFKGLVVLSVLGLWAKHAFTVSNAYMHEAIKRSDRAHAINFGKLYLEIYGNSVDRKELLDIFENWNIASESAFAKANPSGFEPQVLNKLAEVLKLTEKSKIVS